MDLVALEEIRQVKYRYLRCVDLKLWDDLAEVFTPDATVDYGTMVYGQPLTLAGRDEIVAFLRDKLGPDMITVHSAGQPEITVDGDEASIETQFITFDVAGAPKPEGGWPAGTFGAQGAIKPIESGYYRFAFRRTGGTWRIRHQDVIHDIPYVF